MGDLAVNPVRRHQLLVAECLRFEITHENAYQHPGIYHPHPSRPS